LPASLWGNALSSLYSIKKTVGRSASTTTATNTPNPRRDSQENNANPTIKIGIVGGGIMGITVAHSLVETLRSDSLPNCQIIILEGDRHGGKAEFHPNKSPAWGAATARNANTIAVGDSMHTFSSRKMIHSLLSNALQDKLGSLAASFWQNPKKEEESFAKSPPPFFSFQPYYCLGPGAASWNERLAFLAFGLQYGYHALIRGDASTVQGRAQTMVQLAKATRHKFVEEIAPMFGDSNFQQGVLSIHRTKQAAQQEVMECQVHGLPAHELSWEDAIAKEPRLSNFASIQPHVVWRPHDITASCEWYMRGLLDKCCQEHNVQYQHGRVTRIIDTTTSTTKETTQSSGSCKQQYTLITDKGDSTQVDLVVLAAGCEIPLLARIPIYPLRGFSYTLESNNNLQTTMTMDHMYFSSAGPRLTGFGELVGFGKTTSAPSQAPGVLTQYAKVLFGNHINDNDDVTNTPIPCFRPMSPDNLPIVGNLENKKKKGLFLHTGHGTLGWTTAFATADCCVQDIVDYLRQDQRRSTFVLPDGSQLDRTRISPSRFGSWW